jgi:hypothetical protein
MRASSRRLLLTLALGLPCAACSSPSAPAQEPTWPDGGVPDPGTGHQVDIAFDNVPPNDTPDQATPLGTSTMADVTVWITGNAIGGKGNEANYFVFRSGPAAGQFAFNGCFTKPIASMDVNLWKVVEAKVLTPPVATWTATLDDAGMGCLDNEGAKLEASTVYLFGLTATGGAGTYAL